MYSVRAHKEIINCISGVGGAGIGEGAPELVTGSRDGKYSSTCTGEIQGNYAVGKLRKRERSPREGSSGPVHLTNMEYREQKRKVRVLGTREKDAWI